MAFYSPGYFEMSLELLGRHRHLVRSDKSSLGGNGIVVLVNEHVLVDLLSGNLTLLEDVNTPCFQALLYVGLGLVSVGMWLNENKCAVVIVSSAI